MIIGDDVTIEVTQAEICACARVANSLLRLNERVLAEQVIEAIYCLISTSRSSLVPRVRIPMKSAMHSYSKPASDSDLKPAGYSDLMSAT